jgi:hypothetical protein
MMKVQDATSALEPKRHVTHSQKDSTAFSALVKEGQAKLQKEALDRLLTDIEQQADWVMRSRTMESFLRFKRQVQQFMKEAVNAGFELRQSREWHHGGGPKTLTIVKKIDEKLAEMTEQFLRKGQQALDLLADIGEIKGLLMNLYR